MKQEAPDADLRHGVPARIVHDVLEGGLQDRSVFYILVGVSLALLMCQEGTRVSIDPVDDKTHKRWSTRGWGGCTRGGRMQLRCDWE